MHDAGPPGTNHAVMKKAFDEGWGAVIAKTVSLDSSKVKTKTLHTFVCACPWLCSERMMPCLHLHEVCDTRSDAEWSAICIATNIAVRAGHQCHATVCKAAVPERGAACLSSHLRSLQHPHHALHPNTFGNPNLTLFAPTFSACA